MSSLTGEKAYALTSLMIADKERAKKLMLASSGEATEQINALGYNFTEREIIDYSNALRSAILGLNLPKKGNFLDDVNGGVYHDSIFDNLDLNLEAISKMLLTII